MSVVETTEAPGWTRVITLEDDGTYTAVVTFAGGRVVRLTGYPSIVSARYDAYIATLKPDGRSSRQRNHGYVV